MVTTPSVLVHLCTAPDLAQARQRGEHRPASLATAGFVHLSTPEQIHLPANRLYPGRTDLVLMTINARRLHAPLRWEPGVATDPVSTMFPHLYGPLPMSAVIAVRDYPPGLDGRFGPVQSTDEST